MQLLWTPATDSMLLHKQQQKLDMQPDVKNSSVSICTTNKQLPLTLNINLKEKQKLNDIIRGLEQKNADQAKIIHESEKADELRKHQQEKNNWGCWNKKATGSCSWCDQEAQEEAKFKDKAKFNGEQVNVLINEYAPADFNGHFFLILVCQIVICRMFPRKAMLTKAAIKKSCRGCLQKHLRVWPQWFGSEFEHHCCDVYCH